jgi:hypothetical protein
MTRFLNWAAFLDDIRGYTSLLPSNVDASKPMALDFEHTLSPIFVFHLQPLVVPTLSNWWFQPPQIGSSSQILGKLKFMFQTINQEL